MNRGAWVFVVLLLAGLIGAWLAFRRAAAPAVVSPSVDREAVAGSSDDRSAGPARTVPQGGASARAATAPPVGRDITRDERAQLLRSVAEARDRRRAEAQPNAAPVAGDDVGTLDKDYIRDRIREIVPLVKECYEDALRDHPGLGGKMVVQFAIAGEESVGGVIEDSAVQEESTLREPSMVECVRETMYALKLDPPKGGGRVVVRYPFVFAAEAPPDLR